MVADFAAMAEPSDVSGLHGLSGERSGVGTKRKFTEATDGQQTKPTGGKAKNKHVKDCRRYRDKMTKKFEALSQTIPGASVDGIGNHRAKVIDHTMQVLQRLLDETKDLQLQLAMTDKKRLSKWIEKSVSSVQDLSSAAMPLLDLFVNKREWKYAEFWSVESPEGTTAPLLELTAHICGKKISADESDFFEQLRIKHAADKVQPETGLLKTALETMCGKCMKVEPSTSEREQLGQPSAQLTSLAMCLAVPIIVLGHVRGIVALYETVWRECEASEGLQLAEDIASVVGNVYGSASRGSMWSKKQVETSTFSALSSGSDGDDVFEEKRERKSTVSFILNL
eukprot:Plantae.Rhodophyta-Purpureofilum_apyrenoidigerum.ctg23572.p1 GENE.Plantae.Rhodophyta-Purpureofilum_apyrenoidigerum.ctg23572~~Plantae.Rhodophyta-Purpureofilum_apyrenoidigerum.ctg23572.p1  ORF type:complete len:358 (+),score=65.06 Plantae.Rhodophyta-Purpureofilum_apyrenoidigerum.ctg23572:60-1076(+)